MVCIIGNSNNHHSVTIAHAIKHHFLIWMTTVRPPAKRRYDAIFDTIGILETEFHDNNNDFDFH